MPKHPLDHVGIAVESLEASIPVFEALTGAEASSPLELPQHGVAVSFVGELELLEPLGEDSAVGRFLERRGPGVHHVAYRVGNLEAALERFQNEGFEPVDPDPRPGARGHRIVFLHPGTTRGVLVELVESDPGGATRD